MNSMDQVQLSLLSRMDQMRHTASADVIQAARPMEGSAVQGSFTEALRESVLSVDRQAKLAGDKVTAVETGQSDDLVGAMVESQKASVAFTALVQVRNKLSEAFDEIMRMPV